MEHADHVGLIREGVAGSGPRWLELGAGRGAFTLALADLLGQGGEITAVDRDAADLEDLRRSMAHRFPATSLVTLTADFTAPLPAEPGFDGLLAANSLHFVSDPAAVLDRVRPLLRPGARIIVVEYDSGSGNPWVPHPFAYRTWQAMADGLGLLHTRLVGRVPSRFLGAIYAAASDLPASEPVLHSRPHGSDREE